jgi:hypothetical protein
MLHVSIDMVNVHKDAVNIPNARITSVRRWWQTPLHFCILNYAYSNQSDTTLISALTTLVLIQFEFFYSKNIASLAVLRVCMYVSV